MKSGKRFLAFVMSILMVLTVLVPSNIFASSTDATAEDAQDAALVGSGFTEPDATWGSWNSDHTIWTNNSSTASYHKVTATNTYKSLGEKYYFSSRALGIAGNFSVVGFSSVSNYVHTDGNILTNSLSYGANAGTNKKSSDFPEVSYVKSFAKSVSGMKLADSDNANCILAVGKDVTIAAVDNGGQFSVDGNKLDAPKRIYQEQDGGPSFLDIDAVKAQSEGICKNLASTEDTAGVTASYSDQNKQSITVSDGNAVSVYNLDLNNFKGNVVTINGLSNSSSTGCLIINIDMKGRTTCSLPSFYDSANAERDANNFDGHVLLNFYDSSAASGMYAGAINVDNRCVASFLAPDAAITANQNVDGSIIANVVNINGESHRNDFVRSITGIIALTKVATEDTSKILPGATFGVYSDSSCTNLVTTITSTATGKDVSSALPIGNYYVKETTPPSGYQLNDTVFTVVVQAGHTTIVKTGTNEYVTDTKTHVAQPTTARFSVNKAVTGNAYTGTEDFTFDLTAVDPTTAPMPSATTATCKADGTAKFGDITFDAEGIYIYKITEQTGATNGMKYNTSPVYAKVVVTTDSTTGNLVATVTYGTKSAAAADITSAAVPTITNTYAITTTALAVKKTVTSTGDTYSGTEDFTFTLAKGTGSTKTSDVLPSPATATCKAGDVATFGDITYTEAGDYYYTITETQGSANGMSYNTTAQKVKVTVAADATTGALTAEVKYYDADTSAYDIDSNATVDNTYTTAPTTTSFSVKKLVNSTGIAYSGNEEFTFELTSLSANAPMPTSATASCKDNGEAKFGDITFTAAGTYIYKITEKTGTTTGMTYSSTPVYAKVVATVTDGKLGTVVTYGTDQNADSITSATVPTVTNTYAKTENGKANLSVTKTVSSTGIAYSGTENFNFKLEAVTDGAPMPTATTASCANNGTATFGDIAYTAGGTYVYKITETAGTTDGMTYSSAAVYAKVVATVTAGKVSTVVTYGTDSNADSITSATVPTVTNTYAKTENGKANLSVTKTVSSTGIAYSGTENFNFKLEAVTDGAPMPTATTASCANNGTATFGDIAYTAGGTYVYKITETAGTTDGMTYSSAAVYAKVVATEASGVVSTTVTYGTDSNADSITSATVPTVTNTYAKTENGKANLSVTKTVSSTGIAYSGTENFNFKLEAVTDGAPMPTATTASCANNGTATFGDIAYTAGGTYVYKITETAGTTDGMTYSSAAVYAKVVATVTAGKVSTVVTYGTDSNTDSITSATVPTVTNTYAKTENGKANLSVTKTVSSTGIAYSGTENFNFKLEAVTDGAPMPTATTASCANNGTATFGDITYTAGGTYVYKITETAGTTDGMTYSSAAVYAKVVATEASGVVSTTVTYGTDSNADSITSATVPTVTNTYAKTENGKASLSVTKTVSSTGIAYSGTENFNFKLEAVTDGAPMPTATTASCANNGTATFGDIAYTAGGTYVYKITETAGTTDGMTYSSAAVYAKVVATVTAGKVSTVVTYGTDSNADSITSATVPTVTNTYAKTENGKASLSVTKKVSSTGIAYSGTEDFNFKLEAVTDGAPMPTATMASCANNSTATFGEIAYTAGGTYVYKITETAGTTAGMTYSSTAVYAKVVATETAGVVKTTVTYGTDPNADSITSEAVPTVTNTYAKTESGKASLSVMKEINSTGIVYSGTEDFNFKLEAMTEGAPMPTATTASCANNGTATFGEIAYTAGGTYVYKITETAGSTVGMTYSSTAVYAKVVAAMTSGVVSTTVTYGTDPNADSITSATVPTVTNTYAKTENGKASLSVKKEVNSTGIVYSGTESFGFTLTAVTTGAPMPDVTTASCANNGTALFGDIAYTKAGTYVYKITETKGATAGMDYSTTPVYAKVVATETTGVVKTEVTYGTEENADKITSETVPTVTNTYKGTVDVTFSKVSVGGIEIGGAQISILDQSGNVVKDSNGKEIKWESVAGEDHKVTGLTAGTYTMHEDTAPNGYAVSTDITFTIDKNGNVTSDALKDDKVTMTDETKLVFSKVDTGSNEIAGASITILKSDDTTAATDVNGKAISWTSGSDGTDKDGKLNPHTVTGLAAGTYYMHEVTAPDGYSVTTDIKFVVNDNGTVTVGDNNVDKVTMTDKAIQIHISKTDITGSNELKNAVLTVTGTTTNGNPYTNTFTTDGKAGGTEFNIPSGTYTLTETTAPDGYFKAETISFKVTTDGKVEVKSGDTYVPQSSNLVVMKDQEAVKAQIKITKKIANRDWKDGDSFEFTLSAYTSGVAVPMPASDTTITIKDATNPVGTFGEISYTSAGTYIYKISENNGTANAERGITNAAAQYVQVTISRNATTGLYEKSSVKYLDPNSTIENPTWLDYNTSDGVVITNTYNAKEIDVQLAAQKALTGRSWKNGETYTFVLSANNDAAKTILSGTESINASADSTPVSFSEMKFTAAGTYEFKIAEPYAGSRVSGVQYAAPQYVLVTVTDAGEGKLAANVQYRTSDTESWTAYPAEGLTFTNTYSADSTSAALKVLKTLSGRPESGWTDADRFSFTLTADGKSGSDTPMPASGTTIELTNASAANHTGVFGAINYTKTGTYYYDITENSGVTATGVSIAKPQYVRVTVTDNGNGKLVTAIYYSSVNPSLATASDWSIYNSENGIEFVDTYKAAAVETSFPVYKNLTGRDWTNDDHFYFTLTADSTTPAAPVTKGSTTLDLTNGSNHTGSFGSIKFTEAGTYYYDITETNKSGSSVAGTTVNGVTNSQVTYVKAVVTDGNDGQLYVTAYYETGTKPTASNDSSIDWTKLTADSANIGITDSYSVTKTTDEISVKKSFENHDWASGDAFYFTISSDSDNTETAPLPEGTKVSLTYDGSHSQSFGEMTYTKAGTYIYDLTETDENGNSISGTTTANGFQNAGVQYVRVVVTDNGDGTLSTVKTYSTDKKTWNTYKDYVTMVNTYIGTTAAFSFTKGIVLPVGTSSVDWGTNGYIKMKLTGVSATDNTDTTKSLGTVPMPAGHTDGIYTIDSTTTFKKSTTSDRLYFASFDSSDITITQPGTYTYTFVEDSTNVKLMNMDLEEYSIVIKATADATTGKISTEVTYARTKDRIGNAITTPLYKPYKTASNLYFVNNYVLGYTTEKLSITKEWYDSKNLYGTRPTTLSFTLVATFADGTTSEKVYTFDNVDPTAETQKFIFPEALPTTDTDGSAISYSVKETSTQSGYNAPDYSKSASGIIINSLLSTGSVSVLKTDLSGNVLEGAVFNLYLEKAAGTKDTTKDTLVGTVTTDKTGIGTIKGLKAGTYYWVEKTAPSGYEISTEASTALVLTADNMNETNTTPLSATVTDTKIPTTSSTTSTTSSTTSTTSKTTTSSTPTTKTTSYTTVSKASTTSYSTTSTASGAKTGDTAPLEIYTVILIGAFAAIVLALRKRKNG